MLQNNERSFRGKVEAWSGIALSFMLISASVLTSTVQVRAESPEKLNVLIIFSWHKNLPWQIEIENGFNLHYNEISSKPTLFVEYMDAGRFKGQKQIDIFKNYLQEKYANYPIDSVIFDGPPAARLLTYYPELFENSRHYILSPGALQSEFFSDTSTFIPVNTHYESAVNALVQVSQGKSIYRLPVPQNIAKKELSWC